MEWWYAGCAALLCLSTAAAAWQARALMRRLAETAAELERASSQALGETAQLAGELRGLVGRAEQAAVLAGRQLERLAPLAEAAGSLQAAADTAGSAARRIAEQAVGTAEAAAARARSAAGKYRPQLEEAIAIADAALEGWMYVRSAASRFRSPACSGGEQGNPNDERRD
ncbi:hypothetical protein [Paenibacillus sp. B01]|uniref:hypothetical protein n=1 Tax=Paenibacillus sp. B01 TaxID=2660554 RepID=UPI00129B29D5|nr:hypothetical protein [Paenibacillus sp. B01]QGG55701.1 hypothetical protein GE073_09040 [Paenibacillus sp. B01]